MIDSIKLIILCIGNVIYYSMAALAITFVLPGPLWIVITVCGFPIALYQWADNRTREAWDTGAFALVSIIPSLIWIFILIYS